MDERLNNLTPPDPLGNAQDIIELRREIEDLRDARPKRDGLEMLQPVRMPTLGPGSVDRIVGGEGAMVSSVPGADVLMGERRAARAVGQTPGPELMWGVATAPAVRTETTTDAPAHIMPGGVLSSTVRAFVYLWPSNSDGVSSETAPALSSTTADQFIKAWWRDDPRTIQIRGTQVVSYIESDGKHWIEGCRGDEPVYVLEMYIEPDADPTIKPGWHLMDDEDATLRLPNTDVDTLGDIFDVHATATSSVNLASRFPYGMGANSDVGFSVMEAPAWTGKNRFAVLLNGGGAPEVEFGFFSTHYIARVN